MKIIFSILISLVVLSGCGVKSEPEHQEKKVNLTKYNNVSI
jgi:PBP1b-binding outer membrane lipoprotein LpoB